MGGTSSAPVGYELTAREGKMCVTLDERKSRELRKWLKDLKSAVVVVSAEVVVHIQLADASEYQGVNVSLASHSEVRRSLRNAILTNGAFHLELKPQIASCLPGLCHYDNQPPVHMAVREIKAVKFDAEKEVVIIAHQPDMTLSAGNLQGTMYQTPEPSRLLMPLLTMVLESHVGVPYWAVPLKWQLPFPIPKLSEAQRNAALGNDGGFSKAFACKVHVILLRHEIVTKDLVIGSHVSDIVRRQQRGANAPTTTIDLTALIGKFIPNNLKATEASRLRCEMVVAALRCLPFNLVFRTLKLTNFRVPEQQKTSFYSSLAQVLMYNVTLREVDLSQTLLDGAGELLGEAFAVNIQPLVSRLNLSGCNLSNRDFRALLPGLARLWCGGSTNPVSFKLSHNSDISNLTWHLFWQTLIDPKSFAFWPSTPPPPAILNFLQHLDLRQTQACGHAFGAFVRKLTGLCSLAIGPTMNNDSEGMRATYQAISALQSPLETIDWEGMGTECAIALVTHHAKNLKHLLIKGYQGDAGPLLGSWSLPCPNLTVEFVGKQEEAFVTLENQNVSGYAPGALSVKGANPSFLDSVASFLSAKATGLKRLYLPDVHYSKLATAAPTLAACGLQTLHLKGQPTRLKVTSELIVSCEYFWELLATSKSLQDLQMQNQIFDDADLNGLVMVGKFLKTNRSVRSIGFDSIGFSLNLEGVRALRSAFYGNKKVISMQYPETAQNNGTKIYTEEYRRCIDEVNVAKRQIKQLFKRAYSKHNRRWRDKPNREKLPYVERIRVAKRKMGALERDRKKVGQLMDEIRIQIIANSRAYRQDQDEKQRLRIEQQGRNIGKLATKKEQILTKLVTELHKAKVKGRKGKSGKEQIPRAAYYREEGAWPGNNRQRQVGEQNSRWTYYNDPYGARFGYYYGYYSPWHFSDRCRYLTDDEFIHDEVPDPNEVENGEVEGGNEGQEVIHGEHGDGLADGKSNTRDAPTSLAESDVGLPDDGEWGCLTEADVNLDQVAPRDPWENMDTLAGSEVLTREILSPDHLSQIHDEATELGPDVSQRIAPLLDQAGTLDTEVEGIASSMGVEKAVAASLVDSAVVENGFHVEDVLTTLGDAGDFNMNADDDVVDLYGGAGPRDLDDGGPSFGDSTMAALAGARRRARNRKKGRTMRRMRELSLKSPFSGYSNLRMPSGLHDTRPANNHQLTEHIPWDDDLSETWLQEAREIPIEVLSRSDLFSCPDVEEPRRFQSSLVSCSSVATTMPICVTLVTQCSIDRLPNLEEQLVAWKGRASVAVYLAVDEDIGRAQRDVEMCVQRARRRATQSLEVCPQWEVDVSMVRASYDNGPYPINLLRNVALLGAMEQQMKIGVLPSNGAVLLVDVDFRPSQNLHNVLHSCKAASNVLQKRRAVVCAAFEIFSNDQTTPSTTSGLWKECGSGRAEGFHTSHFLQGHNPTNYPLFWSKTIDLKVGTDDCWDLLFEVPFEDAFEPYVVMATMDVPLYDERFQGYGLNKVAHLASVAQVQQRHKQINSGRGGFFVLPGSFLAAPAHPKSDSWKEVYGSSSDDARFNRLCLKGLYRNFRERLKEGKEPVVSLRTQKWSRDLRLQVASAEAAVTVPNAPHDLVRNTPDEILITLKEVLRAVDSPTALQYVSLLQEIVFLLSETSRSKFVPMVAKQAMSTKGHCFTQSFEPECQD